MDAKASVVLSIPAPRDRQDGILRETFALLVRQLEDSPHLDAAYFERFNKPAWGLCFHFLGAPRWIEHEARPLLERRLAAVPEGFAFVPEEAEDKWVGGLRDREQLKRIHHLDSRSCLERLEAEARGELGGSRAQFSFLLVERLLDLFGLAGAERLEFYRRGFQWEVDLGRWDGEVFTVLEEKYESQKDALQSSLDSRPDEDHKEAWGGAESAGIARRLLDSLREPIETLLAAHSAARLQRDLSEFAAFAVRAHGNRLGIHATQEATLRYLAWRARGGSPGGGR